MTAKKSEIRRLFPSMDEKPGSEILYAKGLGVVHSRPTTMWLVTKEVNCVLVWRGHIPAAKLYDEDAGWTWEIRDVYPSYNFSAAIEFCVQRALEDPAERT